MRFCFLLTAFSGEGDIRDGIECIYSKCAHVYIAMKLWL